MMFFFQSSPSRLPRLTLSRLMEMRESKDLDSRSFWGSVGSDLDVVTGLWAGTLGRVDSPAATLWLYWEPCVGLALYFMGFPVCLYNNCAFLLKNS